MTLRSAALAVLTTLFCLLAGQVFADNKPFCEALTMSEAAKVLKEANEEPGVYCQFNCPANVWNLYGFIKNKFPHLEPKDFRAIFFVRPGFINTLRWMDFERNFLMNARGNPLDNRGRRLTWRFHVVLEHNQMIYDFDQSENPIPMSPAEYLEFMFPANLNSIYDSVYGGIRAYVFPGEEFFTLPKDTVVSQDYLVNVVNFNRGVPLTELPKELEKSSSILPIE